MCDCDLLLHRSLNDVRGSSLVLLLLVNVEVNLVVIVGVVGQNLLEIAKAFGTLFLLQVFWIILFINKLHK